MRYGNMELRVRAAKLYPSNDDSRFDARPARARESIIHRGRNAGFTASGTDRE